LNLFVKFEKRKKMETNTLKTKKRSQTQKVIKVNHQKKPDGPPKVIQGGGRYLGFISDTLFDEDLKGW
jgi:hypothetical protein